MKMEWEQEHTHERGVAPGTARLKDTGRKELPTPAIAGSQRTQHLRGQTTPSPRQDSLSPSVEWAH